jgi:hypothetical protein
VSPHQMVPRFLFDDAGLLKPSHSVSCHTENCGCRVHMFALCYPQCEYECEEMPIGVFVDLLRLESVMVKPSIVFTGDIPFWS